ncbi:MAG: VanZ family protein [Spirochaetales bacterium]|nr:VanZ family protein [Spirochaetales bacterium]
MTGKAPNRLVLLLILVLFILPLMLYAGLNKKGYDPVNRLTREEKGGLTFAADSLALTDKGIPLPREGESFTMTMTLDPHVPPRPRFQVFLMINDGNSWNQLILGLWDRSLVIMNGVDFSNRRRTPKLYVPLGEKEGARDLRITSGPEGTTVFIDGEPAGRSGKLILSFPPNRKEARLILGNSLYGRNSWTGTCYALGLDSDSTSWVYDFSSPSNEIFPDGNGLPLRLPERRPVLVKRFLQSPRLWELHRGVIRFDMFVNFFGFIPLGGIIVLLPGRKPARNSIIALVAVFLFSLFLETVQVWIPTRDSSLLDLVLNTLGGAFGIVMANLLFGEIRIMMNPWKRYRGSRDS